MYIHNLILRSFRGCRRLRNADSVHTREGHACVGRLANIIIIVIIIIIIITTTITITTITTITTTITIMITTTINLSSSLSFCCVGACNKHFVDTC